MSKASEERWTLKDWREFCQRLRDHHHKEQDPERRRLIRVVIGDVRRMVGWPSGALL